MLKEACSSSIRLIFMVRLLNNHFTFYISYLGMNYSNVIGFLLFLVFILQFISGILLSCYYSPFSIMAFDSVYYIMIDVNVGWLIRWLHCLGASLFMLFILIHWIRGAWIRLKVIVRLLHDSKYTFRAVDNVWSAPSLLFKF